MSDPNTKTYPLYAIMGKEITDKERIKELADAFNRVCDENADFVAQSVTDENRIAELEAQLKHCEGHAAELEAGNRALRLSALRYRWLRGFDVLCWSRVPPCSAPFETASGENLDAAIDAAREGK
jgi:hypothetical protein